MSDEGALSYYSASRRTTSLVKKNLCFHSKPTPLPSNYGDEGRNIPEVFMRAARYIYKKGRFDRKMLHDAPVVAAICETYECLRPALGHLSYTTPKVVRDARE